MPRYGYGGDALDQYQGTAFDPLTGRLAGGQMVMQVLNQLAGMKEQKKKAGQEDEDRAFQQMARDLQMQGATLDVAAKRQEAKGYVSPGAKKSAELFTEGIAAARDHKNRLEEIKARSVAAMEEDRRRLTITATKQAEDEERKDRVDAARQGREAIVNRQKKYKELVGQLSAYEKLINKVKLDLKKAENAGNEPTAEALRQQLFEANAGLIATEQQRQSLAEEVTGPLDVKIEQKRLPRDLPTKKTGPLGLVGRREPYVPERKSNRRFANGPAGRIYTDDGVTWYDEKTGKKIG